MKAHRSLLVVGSSTGLCPQRNKRVCVKEVDMRIAPMSVTQESKSESLGTFDSIMTLTKGNRLSATLLAAMNLSESIERYSR